MNHSHSDILIVGAGVFGLSTAYHLVRSGYDAAKVTILDRCPPPSNLAASTDLNKIVRADYTDPLYTELGLEAIAAWKSLPFFKNAGVYHQTGWVAMDEEGSDLTDRVRTNFRACGQEGIEELTQEEVKARWDGLLRDTDYSGFGRYYYNASAGWADAGAAVRVMADEVAKMGVRYCVGEAERVVLGTQSVQGVKVQTGEVYTANKVLLSTGAWTSSLMSPAEDELGIPDENRVESQITAAGVCVAHIQLTEEEKEMYNQLPVFVYGGQGVFPLSLYLPI